MAAPPRGRRAAARRAARPAVLAIAVAVSVGCGGGAEGPAADGGPRAPAVELGTGTFRFEPIPATGEPPLELVAGPQGGFHLDVSARLTDLDLDGLELTYEARPVGGGPALQRPNPTVYVVTPARVIPDGRGGHLKIGDLLVLDVGGPEDVRGMRLTVSVTAADRTGARAADRRTVLVVDEAP